MRLSTDRILTSHVGSLPRNERLADLLVRQEAGEAIDTDALAREIEKATNETIDAQVKAGVDVGNESAMRAGDESPEIAVRSGCESLPVG